MYISSSVHEAVWPADTVKPCTAPGKRRRFTRLEEVR
jgi:hypothetical protein